MVEVKFKRADDTNTIPIEDGQLVYNTRTGETFMDVGFTRLSTGAATPPTLSEASKGWVGLNKAWNVSKNGQIINLSKTVPFTVSSWNTYSSNPYLGYSDIYSFPLDMPMANAIPVGACANIPLYMIGANSTKTRVTFRAASDVKLSTPHNNYMRLNVNGLHATPPANPQQTGKPGPTGNQGLCDCALSYLHARENGRAFVYADSFTYPNYNKVNDGIGRAKMKCDTLVFMSLMGIPYANSPYATTTPDYTFDFDNLVINPTGDYLWTNKTKELAKTVDNEWVNGFGGRIVSDSTMNWWFWDNAYVFKDVSQLQSGDIALFRRLESDSFDNIGHCGVIEMVNGEPYLVHVTTGAWTDNNVVVKSRLRDEFYNLSPGRYLPENTYFARINFNVT